MDQTAPFLLGELFTRKRLIGVTNDALPQVNAQFLHEYAGQLKQAVEVYFRLSTPDASPFTSQEKIAFERIGRLRGHGASVLMLSLFLRENSAAKRAALLDAYERYLFCVSLRAGNRGVYGQRYLQIETIKFIRGKYTTDELVTYYNNSVDQLFKDEAVADILHDWVKNGPGYYGWRSINYFLYEYEMSLQVKSRTSRTKIDWADFSKENYQTDYISVEHIYPQKAKAAYWTDRFSLMTISQRRALRNSLGNLLALSKPKNSSLSNKPFPEKIDRESDTVGYRYGSYSENEVATSADWGPEDIAERGVRMLSFLENRWRIPLGEHSQKVRALGLPFMIKK